MSVYALNNFFHLLATVTWIGGMIFMNFILYPAQSVISPPERGKLMGSLAKRFSIAAWISVIVLIITGLVKTPEGFLLNTSTTFGVWLTVKHIAIILMIIFGLYISLGLAPKLGKLAPKPGEQPRQEFLKTQALLGKFSITNMILGIIVLFCVSMMKF